MIDKTNQYALEQLKKQYGNQIIDYKYEVRKEPYLGRPPKGAFCTGITRYRKTIKTTHIVLRDGRQIPVGATGIGCLLSALFICSFVLILSFVCIEYSNLIYDSILKQGCLYGS